MRNKLDERGRYFGGELAVALVLAGKRTGRDRQKMREMAAVAAREMRAAVEWLRQGALPETLVNDYEHACREGFQTTLHMAMLDWQEDRSVRARKADLERRYFAPDRPSRKAALYGLLPVQWTP